MKNELFTIGPFTVYSYGFMIASVSFRRLTAGRGQKIPCKIRVTRYFFQKVVVSGWRTSKLLLFWITEWKEVAADPGFILRTMTDGFVVYGGIIEGIIAGWLYSRITKLNFLKYFDLMILSRGSGLWIWKNRLPLAGCCYEKKLGRPSNFMILISPLMV